MDYAMPAPPHLNADVTNISNGYLIVVNDQNYSHGTTIGINQHLHWTIRNQTYNIQASGHISTKSPPVVLNDTNSNQNFDNGDSLTIFDSYHNFSKKVFYVTLEGWDNVWVIKTTLP
jgi:hypothetical protein